MDEFDACCQDAAGLSKAHLCAPGCRTVVKHLQMPFLQYQQILESNFCKYFHFHASIPYFDIYVAAHLCNGLSNNFK